MLVLRLQVNLFYCNVCHRGFSIFEVHSLLGSSKSNGKALFFGSIVLVFTSHAHSFHPLHLLQD